MCNQGRKSGCWLELDADARWDRISRQNRAVLADQSKAPRGAAGNAGKERFESGGLDRDLNDTHEISGVIDAPLADRKDVAGRRLGHENPANEDRRAGVALPDKEFASRNIEI